MENDTEAKHLALDFITAMSMGRENNRDRGQCRGLDLTDNRARSRATQNFQHRGA
jgi:hypothetical protein